MYKYHFSFRNFEEDGFTRISVRDHELSDEEVQQELSSIFKEYENIKDASLICVEEDE
jgi:hypothetical protein